MKRLKSKPRYQLISLLHELLLLFITSFILFPSRVKRIICCFIYSENHYPSCTYSSLDEDILQPCITDVDSVVLPQPIHRDDQRVSFPSKSEQPCDFEKIEVVSNPVQISAPLAIISEPDQQLTIFSNPPTAFQVKIRMKIFKPLKLPLLLHPYPDDCYEYLPWFSGENQTSAERHVESFLDFIDRFSIAHEDVIMRMFSKSLIKDAATWFKSLRADSIGSWTEFSNVFLKYWGEYKSLDSYLADFYALKREQNEALPVFNRRFHRIYHDIPLEVRPTEMAAMIHYVTCLHSELALLLLERKSSSLTQSFENAQEVEENIRASRWIQMQDDSENLQTYEQEDCQYISDFEQERNEFEADLEQQPEGEYISDSKSDSSVCVEYSGDMYDYEVYDQFTNQNQPMITHDRIENYMFLADHNPHHLDISLSSSTEDRPEESSEFEMDLDQQLEVVQLSPEEDNLPFPDLQGLSNPQQNHNRKISNPHHDNHSDASVFVSNTPTVVSCHEDQVFISENLEDVEQTDRFRSAVVNEDNLQCSDLQGSPHFPDLQTKADFSPDEESDGGEELSSLDEQPSPADLEQFTHITEIKEDSQPHHFHLQAEQKLEETFHYYFIDPIADFLESLGSIKIRVFLSDESCFYHFSRTHLCRLHILSFSGLRSICLSANKFLTWLCWKCAFT